MGKYLCGICGLTFQKPADDDSCPVCGSTDITNAPPEKPKPPKKSPPSPPPSHPTPPKTPPEFPIDVPTSGGIKYPPPLPPSPSPTPTPRKKWYLVLFLLILCGAALVYFVSVHRSDHSQPVVSYFEVVVVAPSVNIRSVPIIKKDNIVGQVKQNGRLRATESVKASNRIWHKITYNGKEAFVAASTTISLKSVPKNSQIVVLNKKSRSAITVQPETNSQKKVSVGTGFFFVLTNNHNAVPQNLYSGMHISSGWYAIYHKGQLLGYMPVEGTALMKI